MGKMVVGSKTFHLILYGTIFRCPELFFLLFYQRRKLTIYLGNTLPHIVFFDFYADKKHEENISDILNCSILCILVDSYEAEFPDMIEEYLQHGAMKCIAFNLTGTLLAGNYLSLLVFKYIQVFYVIIVLVHVNHAGFLYTS